MPAIPQVPPATSFYFSTPGLILFIACAYLIVYLTIRGALAMYLDWIAKRQAKKFLMDLYGLSQKKQPLSVVKKEEGQDV